mmetsp:Transcript_40950/g.136357  ORF Transcript_40950/g.136357 Transcript_40950/m.136357 type:complete len:263 (+) Transcript_40950:130-918(+)
MQRGCRRAAVTPFHVSLNRLTTPVRRHEPPCCVRYFDTSVATSLAAPQREEPTRTVRPHTEVADACASCAARILATSSRVKCSTVAMAGKSASCSDSSSMYRIISVRTYALSSRQPPLSCATAASASRRAWLALASNAALSARLASASASASAPPTACACAWAWACVTHESGGPRGGATDSTGGSGAGEVASSGSQTRTGVVPAALFPATRRCASPKQGTVVGRAPSQGRDRSKDSACLTSASLFSRLASPPSAEARTGLSR